MNGSAQLLGIGRRQLERQFPALTGQTPIEVRPTSRFQKTVRTLLLDPAADTTDVALAQGYYDQAHFIRDYRAVVAASPRTGCRQHEQRRIFTIHRGALPEEWHLPKTFAKEMPCFYCLLN
ncbi:MAG TPA: helix-turn-helix domain-containing protein [Noviherbaspirillum sp.]|nr:helix-turn-helix domain-containing protein [Noviherbaspirillum sp.]